MAEYEEERLLEVKDTMLVERTSPTAAMALIEEGATGVVTTEIQGIFRSEDTTLHLIMTPEVADQYAVHLRIAVQDAAEMLRIPYKDSVEVLKNSIEGYLEKALPDRSPEFRVGMLNDLLKVFVTASF